MKKEITYGDLNTIELLSIEQLNTHPQLKEFYVASYQRGYRWGKEEVEYLLNDIYDIASDKKYCIQPLAVIAKGNKSWELIDGQQRTTTLFLIQTVLKNCFSIQTEPFYGLNYNTRSSTKDFLNDIRTDNILKEYLINIKIDDIVKKEVDIALQEKWEEFIKSNADKDNVDNYHLFNAYFIILIWLLPKSSDQRYAFYKKLTEQTYVIWHPITIEKEGIQTVEDFFINMNAGKIKLTSAELIKALFIIDIEKSDDPWDVRDFKKKKLANEWDSIENELHNNTFWYFINNTTEQDYPTRIGKLFDIDCKKTKDASELFSYYQYNKGKDKGGENLDWKKIKQIYQRLKEWYDDVENYHLIGFIINAKFMTLEDIIAKTENKTKLKIKDFFIQTIKDKFAQEITQDNQRFQLYALNNLRYDTSYNQCKNTLLLYNIKLIERTFPNQRFPFDLYQDPETQWSIEHIHPQNPQLLKSKEDAEEWLKDYAERYKEEDKESENNTKIAVLLQKLYDLKDSTLTIELSNEIKDFSNTVNDALGLHFIGNQALLDKITNSTIGNKSFLKKRSLILDASTNTNGTYIPLGTINNFLKKTTNTGVDNKIKVSYWSSQDAEDYTKDIEKLLENFLPKSNK
ncbi:DUF262 domain-containing protein [Flavobacterium sp.]|uniref:DUF262 domain-containing protein n=1 Tax=Flavobacterium sp. TaxID=239 RepID=UPI0025C56DB9|nr:DUF262 domain-containing protein [Flavobacterium sp.]MBA4155554.1 hypothetical protein [Flavobacterium sp.]